MFQRNAYLSLNIISKHEQQFIHFLTWALLDHTILCFSTLHGVLIAAERRVNVGTEVKNRQATGKDVRKCSQDLRDTAS